MPDAPAPTMVIGVDGGAAHARAMGLDVDVVVGDLDSLDDRSLAALQAEGVVIEEHPTDKDRSDLDLAIAHAAALRPEAIEIVSAGGGQIDHLLIGVLLLGRSEIAALPIRAHIGGSMLSPVPNGSTHRSCGRPGDLLTVLAVGGPATVTTSGLKWNLDATTVIEPGASLGLSNVVLDADASVRTESGTVLLVATPR